VTVLDKSKNRICHFNVWITKYFIIKFLGKYQRTLLTDIWWDHHLLQKKRNITWIIHIYWYVILMILTQRLHTWHSGYFDDWYFFLDIIKQNMTKHQKSQEFSTPHGHSSSQAEQISRSKKIYIHPVYNCFSLLFLPFFSCSIWFYV